MKIDIKTPFLMQNDELQDDQKLIAHDIRYTECQAKQIEKQYNIKIPAGAITPNTGIWILYQNRRRLTSTDGRSIPGPQGLGSDPGQIFRTGLNFQKCLT